MPIFNRDDCVLDESFWCLQIYLSLKSNESIRSKIIITNMISSMNNNMQESPPSTPLSQMAAGVKASSAAGKTPSGKHPKSKESASYYLYLKHHIYKQLIVSLFSISNTRR
jgi:hypothetical protein